MKATRYTNKNAFTVFLPTPRGGQVAFHQGQGTTDPWYSRFLGNKQLSAEQVEIDDKGKIRVLGAAELCKASLAAEPPKDNDIIVAATRPPTPVFVDEETADYTRTRGILTCKLCGGMFRTGSSLAMKEHLEGYHARPTQVPEQQVKQEVVVESNKGPVEQIVDETKTEAPPPAVTTESSPMGDTLFVCTHPGCDKKFVSEKGLVMHKRRAHQEK